MFWAGFAVGVLVGVALILGVGALGASALKDVE